MMRLRLPTAPPRALGPKGRDNDFGYELLDIKAADAAKERVLGDIR
jgi:hypothetical protein